MLCIVGAQSNTSRKHWANKMIDALPLKLLRCRGSHKHSCATQQCSDPSRLLVVLQVEPSSGFLQLSAARPCSQLSVTCGPGAPSSGPCTCFQVARPSLCSEQGVCGSKGHTGGAGRACTAARGAARTQAAGATAGTVMGNEECRD